MYPPVASASSRHRPLSCAPCAPPRPPKRGGEGGDDPSCNKMCVTGTAFTGFTMCVPARLRSYWLCANVQSVSITSPWIPLPPRVELQAHTHTGARRARRAPRGGGTRSTTPYGFTHTRHTRHTHTDHCAHTAHNGQRGSASGVTPARPPRVLCKCVWLSRVTVARLDLCKQQLLCLLDRYYLLCVFVTFSCSVRCSLFDQHASRRLPEHLPSVLQ